MEAATQMHIEDQLEILVRQLLQGSAAHDAGVVDQDVDAPVVVQCRLDDRLAARGSCH